MLTDEANACILVISVSLIRIRWVALAFFSNPVRFNDILSPKGP